MEKAREQKPAHSVKANKSLVWDCGSSLYDSFELKSFERQLDSTIASRTYSMPRLSDPRPRPPVSKKSSKISRSLHKFLRIVFGSKPTSSSVLRIEDRSQDGYQAFHYRSAALSTIPEVPEMSKDNIGVSPELDSVVRRSVSERFTATPLGISCA